MASLTKCIKCGKELVPNALFCPHCGVKVAQENPNSDYDDPYIGTTIDNTFVVESILGTGSMGVVYKARHRALDCYVAIKILKHDYLDNRLILTRFQREAQAASGVQHPNVIRILHYGKTVLNAPYIAMECLEGEDLSDIIVRDFPFTQHRIANIILQVARALGAAHDAKIIHRDLKPANIKIIPQPDGTDLVKVLDFGIAKITDDGGEGLTREGTICGTPAFMSPEQVLGKTVSPATDIFSLGSIMYFMLTCKLPFEGASLVDMASSILTTQLTPPSRVRLDAYVDPQLEIICLKALSKDVAARYQNGHELENALATVIPSLTESTDAGVKKSCVIALPASDEMPMLNADEETNCAVSAYETGHDQAAPQPTPQPAQDPMTEEDAATIGFGDDDLDFETNIADSGECTMIDQRAFDDVDEEEGATQIAIQAATDDEFPDMPLVAPPVMTARPSLAQMPSASPAVPNRIPYGNQAAANPMTYHPLNAFEEEKRHKKMLLLLIIALVTTFCIIIILVVAIININDDDKVPEVASDVTAKEEDASAKQDDKDIDEKKDAPVAKDDSDVKAAAPAAKSDEVELTPFQISALVDNIVQAGSQEIYNTAIYGAYYGIVPDNADDKAKAEATQEKEAPKAAETAVAQKTDTKASTTKSGSTSNKKSTSSKSTNKKSSGGGSSTKKKLAEADKLFSSGNTNKACAIYKTIVNDSSLSKQEKLAIQGKIRRCGRVVL